MNLTGKWKGQYRYGTGYPAHYIGKSDPFEFDIVDINGVIKGTCIDNIVRQKEGNASTIEGVFKDKNISFLKKYKHRKFIGKEINEIPPDDIKVEGIQYTGYLYRRIFSRKYYFSGEWSIISEYTDRRTSEKYVYVVKGTWSMSRVE